MSSKTIGSEIKSLKSNNINNDKYKENKDTKIYWKCALSNTIYEVLVNRKNYYQTQNDSWNFYWVNREWMNTSFDKHKFKDNQLVCHFRNDHELTRKDNLIKNLKKAKKIPELEKNLNFIPLSYVLPSEWHLFVEEFKKYNNDNIWIMKPVAGAQGKGIFLFKKLKEITEWKKKDYSSDCEALPYVTQMYIKHPYLIGGKKFDIRLYVLVRTFRPLTVWVHREGFARFSHSKYDLSCHENAYVHLTNVAIAKTAGDFDPEKGLKWSLRNLFRYIMAVHGAGVVRKIQDDIGNIIITSLKSVQPLMIQDKHCFELYGYDILLDENLKGWLLEVNASPSLTPSSQDDFEMKFRVLNHMLDVLDLEKKLLGNEIEVNGFDLLIKNNEIVYSNSYIPKENEINPLISTLNIKLGHYVKPMETPFHNVSVLGDQIENVHHTKEEEERVLHKIYEPGSSKKLTEHLMGNHNPNAPPDGVLEVHYEMELVHILGIDELKQTMTALVYVDEKWIDPSLSWNPKEFGGLNKTWLPMHVIWMPDIIIFNMVSASRLHHEDLLSKVRAPVVVYSNGTVECSHPAVYTVSCEINIRHFPLDDQRCALEIASWAYSWEKIRLLPHVEHSLEHYTPNEEWHLQNVKVKRSEYEHEGILVSQIEYEVSVRRKPLFYMVTLTFPSFVMCSISIVGLFARFSTTGEREERFTLGVTAILTMAVLSLVVSEKVPHSSTSVPLLVAYFLFNMVSVSFAAMTTGVVMKIHRKGRFGKEPPSWIMKLFMLKENPNIPLPEIQLKSQLSKPKEIIIEHDGINSSKTTLKHSESDDMNGLINDKLESEYYGEKEYYSKGSLGTDSETMYGVRLRKIKKISTRLDDYLHCIQCDYCDHECRNQITSAKIKHEYNGYVRIAERLDCVFMWIFLSAVTLPVVILFWMM